MQIFVDTVVNISGWLWGPPILILLTAASIFLSVRLGFFQFLKFGYIFKSTFCKAFSKSDHNRGEGTVSAFQALTSALGCTVGAGSIVGVPVAITMGGPGAVFWMWLIAFLGMALKYGEIVLAVKYREVNAKGEFVGGPVYYMTNGMKMKWMAAIFGVSLMIEAALSSLVQANALAGSAEASLNIPPLVSGIVVMIIGGVVVIGGVKRLGSFTEKLVPFMASLYILASIVIVMMNFEKIPEVFGLIFYHAFTPMSAVGGFAGSSVAMAIRWGVARGIYTNEAGVGTAPIAHSAATTDHPARQALWGIAEVTLTTLVICSCTAFVVLCTDVWKIADAADVGGTLATVAFGQAFGAVGGVLVTISLILFVMSTIIVLIWYGEKQAEFLFGSVVATIYRFVCVFLIPLGAVGAARYLWQFLDLALALILIPNVIAILYLNKDIVAATKEFFGTEGKYYLKDLEEAKAAKKKA